MAIDTRTIDTDLTLELDEDEITVAEFASALEHFTGLVREVTKRLAPRSKPTWLIRIYPGSAGIGFYSKPGVITESVLSSITSAVMDGINELENGSRPIIFNDRAIEHAKSISLVFHKRERPSRIRVWRKNEHSVPVKKTVAETASRILEATYEDDGSIEGTLEVLSGHGGIKVTLYDPLDDRAIKCDVSIENLQMAINSFMKRVEVFGKIRYRRDGHPVSVKVDRIVPFPNQDEIPSLSSIKGILRG